MSARAAGLIKTAALLFFTTAATAADQSAGSLKSPLSPEESLAAFHLAPEVRIELVAAEPEVVSPVSIAFDELGRLWVVEMSDYPNGPVAGEPPKSRIKLLEDRDGDGRFERAHIFAHKLLFATGVQPWRGGVIVTLAGEVAYFKDTDGDNKADVRETWFRGFAQENPQLRANHPRFALDNHIYVANGLKGGTIVANKEIWGRELPAVPISGKDFRFDPLTGECEAVSGNGQFGLTFDDFGNRFVCSNRNPCRHVVLEERYLKRNPFLAVRDVVQDVSPPAEKSRIFPISRAWTTSNLHAGQFTAACGVLIYRGDALPTELYGNSFVCEPTGNLVHRDILEPDGATFKSHYAPGDVEFLASRDEWFRPVDLANGPDGALYVVDMYRAVIEHPEWVPAELKNRPDLYDGSDRGRIYRIVSRDRAIDRNRRGTLNLGLLSSRDLAALITHPNAWHRETAARLLFERQDKSAVAVLTKIAESGTALPTARALAIHLLDRLRATSGDLLDDLLTGSNGTLRDRAIVLLEPRLRRSPEFGEELAGRASLRSLQVALSLGEAPSSGEHSDKVSDALATILLDNLADQWVRAAVLSSAQRPHATRLFESIIGDDAFAAQSGTPTMRQALRELAEMIGADAGVGSDEFLPWLGQALPPGAAEGDRNAIVTMLAVIDGFGQGVARRGAALREFIGRTSPELKLRLDVAFGKAVALAGSERAPMDARLQAISVLRFASFDLAFLALNQLIESDAAQEIRLAAIESLGRFDEASIALPLLSRTAGETPVVRRRVYQAMLRSNSRTKLMLDALETGRRLGAASGITVAELDSATVQALINHRDESIREHARRLLAAAIPAERKQVLERYQPALTLKADPKRGRTVFEKNCANCHKIGDFGVDVAPNISDSRTKTAAQLLTDILNPNQAIDNNYVSYTVLTKDGKTETGIVAAETASSITLRQPEGKTVLVLRTEIDEMRSNGVSLMPEGLEKNVSVEQMADLISFIKNWRYLDGSVPLGTK